MKTKSELKDFDNEIAAEVEAFDNNDVTTSELNKNEICSKVETIQKSANRGNNLDSMSDYCHILLASLIWPEIFNFRILFL